MESLHPFSSVHTEILIPCVMELGGEAFGVWLLPFEKRVESSGMGLVPLERAQWNLLLELNSF